MSQLKREQATVLKDVTYAFQCDACKKVVEGRHLPEHWFNYSHYHNNWGNDSVDSQDSFDVCSAPCLRKALEESLDYMDRFGSDTGVIMDMPYLMLKELLNPVEVVKEN